MMLKQTYTDLFLVKEDMMTDKEYRDNFPAGIPCKVEKSDVNAIDEEIMLISANHDVRESSMEVKRWEVSRLLELYEAKKLKGEIKNIHAEIANQLNISERQARKYTTAEKLIPELSELLNSNGIDLNQADKFGKLDEDAQKTILSIIQKNGTIENAEFQSIKKLSEERADEAREYKKQLDSATKEIEDKEQTIRLLEQKISSIQQNDKPSNTEQDKDDMVKFAMLAKEKAEKEKQQDGHGEAQVEKLKQQQKEKEQRQTSISDSELKRINSIAKLEQSLTLLENNFDILKNNKSVIKNDAELKIRVEILKDRLVDLIDNL